MFRREDFWIEPLTKRHNRADFSCGSNELDRYLRAIARQDLQKSAAAIYVATHDGTAIAGFYTLSQTSIDLELLPTSLKSEVPKYPKVPATLLGRLAVDTRFQGIGLGQILLLDALARVCSVASIVASTMVVVDAKDESTRFYEAYGFTALRDLPNRLVLPLKTAREIILE